MTKDSLVCDRIKAMKKPSATISLELNKDKIDDVKRLYSDIQSENNSEYIVFFAKRNGLSVTVYKPDKHGLSSVVFQGPDALYEARVFDENAAPKEIKPKRKENAFPSRFPQIGSDEVGTGDAFGPIVVCAAYVEEKDVSYLKSLNVTDSKLLKDEDIRKIGKTLIKKFDYSLLSLMPSDFNDVHDENNMNRIKARMHNRALSNLYKRHPNAYIYMDQFAKKETYYSYLYEDKEVLDNIHFSTKGETHYISVALGSVIARYAFLLKMDELSEKLGHKIPFGAGKDVDGFIAEISKEKTRDELKEYAKLSFKNFNKDQDNFSNTSEK